MKPQFVDSQGLSRKNGFREADDFTGPNQPEGMRYYRTIFTMTFRVPRADREDVIP